MPANHSTVAKLSPARAPLVFSDLYELAIALEGISALAVDLVESTDAEGSKRAFIIHKMAEMAAIDAERFAAAAEARARECNA
ncbi:MAG: hypothetical protein KJZ96_17365 [Rhodocyclaceae bacterium]|nr:hypothetical protein [Rhodocyclaceae bacterium]